jgi:hypothetical protein
MAPQSATSTARAPAADAAPRPSSAPAGAGPALSTRETTARPFVELGVMFGQALGGREPVMQALTNLQAIGQEHGCDAIIAVKLMNYTTPAGTAVVAYGTGVRFLPTTNTPAGQTSALGPDSAPAVPPGESPDGKSAAATSSAGKG